MMAIQPINRPMQLQMRVNQMTRLVADGMRVTHAGAAMGLTKGETAHCWRMIKADCGLQAV